MKTRRNALLLFSKVPEPGKVKTRLTPLKDGIFDPEDASYLYHCMLFDVAEICCEALADLERANTRALECEGACAGAAVSDEYVLIISSASFFLRHSSQTVGTSSPFLAAKAIESLVPITAPQSGQRTSSNSRFQMVRVVDVSSYSMAPVGQTFAQLTQPTQAADSLP